MKAQMSLTKPFFQVADFIEICQIWIHIETMT